MSKILCCLCGVAITPNGVAMCVDCIRSEVDITSSFDKTAEIIQCKKCSRWNVSRDNWAHHDVESSSLLAVCLKKIHGLDAVKILHAKWIWTEPHSKRMKVSVDIERSVLENRATIQQNLVIEFVIVNKQCLQCIHEATDHSWGALLQIRQRVTNKSTLCMLEDIILKSGFQDTIINLEVTRDGLDLYFKSKNLGERMAEMISGHIPTKIKQSKKLISKNIHTSEAKYEHTIYLEIAPLCRGDLVVTAKGTAGGGRGSDLLLVHTLSSCLHLLSPVTGRLLDVPAVKYFAKPFEILLTQNHLTSFVVLDITPVESQAVNPLSSKSAVLTGLGASTMSFVTHSVLADAEVCRECDLGTNDRTYLVRTHLGAVLRAGDYAWGYDLVHTVVDDFLLEDLPYDRPDIILVRKSYADKVRKRAYKKKTRGRKGRSRTGGNAAIEPADIVEVIAENVGVEDGNKGDLDLPAQWKHGEIHDHAEVEVENGSDSEEVDECVDSDSGRNERNESRDDKDVSVEFDEDGSKSGNEGRLLGRLSTLFGADEKTSRNYSTLLLDEQAYARETKGSLS